MFLFPQKKQNLQKLIFKIVKIKKLQSYYRIFDFLFIPLMWFFGKFTFPLQETHKWHTYRIDPKGLKKSAVVNSQKSKSRFGHEAGYGLFHMPIFGGLDQYVVLEVLGLKDYWYVGWKGGETEVHKLPIKQSRIKLLTPLRGSYEALGFDKHGNQLKLKVVGYGKIGDGRFSGVRLF